MLSSYIVSFCSECDMALPCVFGLLPRRPDLATALALAFAAAAASYPKRNVDDTDDDCSLSLIVSSTSDAGPSAASLSWRQKS